MWYNTLIINISIHHFLSEVTRNLCISLNYILFLSARGCKQNLSYSDYYRSLSPHEDIRYIQYGVHIYWNAFFIQNRLHKLQLLKCVSCNSLLKVYWNMIFALLVSTLNPYTSQHFFPFYMSILNNCPLICPSYPILFRKIKIKTILVQWIV